MKRKKIRLKKRKTLKKRKIFTGLLVFYGKILVFSCTYSLFCQHETEIWLPLRFPFQYRLERTFYDDFHWSMPPVWSWPINCGQLSVWHSRNVGRWDNGTVSKRTDGYFRQNPADIGKVSISVQYPPVLKKNSNIKYTIYTPELDVFTDKGDIADWVLEAMGFMHVRSDKEPCKDNHSAPW